jgi:diguanylate cyclase
MFCINARDVMRYSESKEQSSELLRLSLPLMARQNAAFHPVSYSLWYEHVAGMNPPLSEVLASRLKENKPLTEDDVYRLHAQFISARDVQLLESLELQLRHVLDDTAQQAATAGEETGRFRRALQQSQSELTGARAVHLEGVNYIISQVLSGTVRMEASAAALAEKLKASVDQVHALKERLRRAESEALLALRDPLCGIHNRLGLERAVQQLNGGIGGVALLLADVDHFKKVNDSHGHVFGDNVMRAIAEVIQANIKGRDVGARYGGDEFAILLPETTLHGALALAEQLRQVVASGRVRKGQGQEVVGSVTLSIGVAVGQPGETFEALMERADTALYKAKHSGRNRVCTSPTS